VDDIERDGQLHAAVLRSSVAHGIIRGIDTSAARELPGVHAIITAEDLGGVVPRIPVRLFPNEAMKPFLQPVIASDRVRYVGEPIALVVADTPAIAEDALELINVDIDQLPAVSQLAESGTAGCLFDDRPDNKVFDYRVRRGDAAAAFANADYTRRERLYVHRHTGITMETRGVVAEWDPIAGKMTCWGALKVPFANRRILASLLGLPEDSVEMIEGDAGGSFGVRGESGSKTGGSTCSP
jgi:carbon-monoxide dehydrogenase large subunit